VTAPTEDVLPVSDLEPPGRSPAPRIIGVLAVVLLVAAVVAAVLVRSTDDRTPEERFAAVPAAIAEEPFAFEIRLAGTAASTPIEFLIEGVADPATQRTKAEMDLSSMLPAGSGISPTFAFIGDGTVLYLQVPGAPTPWVKMDAAALTSGVGGGALPSSTNPIDSYEQLRAVSGPIEEVGKEDIRGTSTTHFRTTLDLTKLLGDLPAERRPPAELSESFRAVPLDLWLDSEDRPRRQTMQFEVTGGGQTAQLSMTIDAFAFGQDVTIDVPPADQVTDAGSNLGGLFGRPGS
jgi:hypothetical protein